MPTDAGHALLTDAIVRNVPVTLSIPAAGPGEVKRSRLLAEQPAHADATSGAGAATRAGAAGVWVESVDGHQLVLDALRQAGKPIGVSFRFGEHLIRFAARIVRREPAFRLSDAVAVEALLLAWPADVEVAQRRSGYRVKRPLDADVTMRAWTLPGGDAAAAGGVVTSATGGPAEAEIRADLRDLSVGGLGAVFRAPRGGRLSLAAGDRLRVELTADGRTVAALGRIRYAPRVLPDGALRAGLDFEGLTDTLEGRRASALVGQLVAEFQRTEARRRRAG